MFPIVDRYLLLPWHGLLLLLIALGGPGAAQERNDADELAVWIRELGHANYEVRERATQQLLQLGPASLEALRQLPADLPREARQRATVVLKEIEQQQIIKTSQAFLLDVGDQQDFELPAWNAFRELTGSSRTSKLLYLELLKSQPQLAQHLELVHQRLSSGQDSGPQQQALAQAATEQALQLMPRIFRGAGIGIGDSAAMMLSVALLDGLAPIEVSQLIHSTIQLGFFSYINRPGYKPCLQRLVAAWIPKTHEALAPEVMRIAYDLDLPVILPIARQHLSKIYDKMTREYALFCLAKFGDAQDIPELLKLISDDTIVHEFDDNTAGITIMRVAPPGIPADPVTHIPHKLVRINDLAAATAMILLDEDPRQLFPRYTRELFFSRSLSPLAVEESEVGERNEKLKAWAASHYANLSES